MSILDNSHSLAGLPRISPLSPYIGRSDKEIIRRVIVIEWHTKAVAKKFTQIQLKAKTWGKFSIAVYFLNFLLNFSYADFLKFLKVLKSALKSALFDTPKRILAPEKVNRYPQYIFIYNISLSSIPTSWHVYIESMVYLQCHPSTTSIKRLPPSSVDLTYPSR